jgi:hypothetical protein
VPVLRHQCRYFINGLGPLPQTSMKVEKKNYSEEGEASIVALWYRKAVVELNLYS